MTDKEKLEKIKRLADDMYNKMAYLTSDTRPIRKAMDDYHSFIVHEYNKDEQVDKPIDFEQELYKAFGQVKDFTLGMQIARRFYEMGKQHQEPVSEDLEEASKEWLRPQLDKSYANYGEAKMMELTHFDGYAMLDAIEFGAKWQKEQIMEKAIDGVITFDYYGDNDKTYGCIAQDSFCLEDFGLKDRDKVKVIVIKED